MYAQKVLFDEAMTAHKRDFIIFHLDITDDQAMERLLHRKICPSCGTTYSTVLEPNITHCHEDNTLLTTRIDDQSHDVVQERFSLYHSDTKPLLDEYNTSGKVVHIDGTLPIDEITDSIIDHLS